MAPPLAQVESLFAGLGQAIRVGSEEHMADFGCAAGLALASALRHQAQPAAFFHFLHHHIAV